MGRRALQSRFEPHRDFSLKGASSLPWDEQHDLSAIRRL